MNPQFRNNTTFAAGNATGRRTVFWFRMYCALMSLIYLLVFFIGAYLAIVQPVTRQYGKTEVFIVGVAYAIVDALLLLLFGFGLTVPARRSTWIYGIVLIAIGMTSVCFLPITIPLLIFWIKPETKAVFGRE